MNETKRRAGNVNGVDIAPSVADLVCFSHLRWNFVFQRPQHLMTRFAAERRVFYFEEPLFDAVKPFLESYDDRGVTVVVPHLVAASGEAVRMAELRALANEMLSAFAIHQPVLWYYTPMALQFSRDLAHSAVVYDCMDELSAFAGAPPGLLAMERELLQIASLVFTGGQSLYEAKRERHPRVHAFPSSVDVAHFAHARSPQPDPQDQAGIPHPRIGYYGVIDERMDLELLAAVARRREDWHLIMLGPVVKIDAAALPTLPNIHYLGMKQYEELPAYLAGWDVAMLPFARNASTRFISPTKTPEYLAAGRPVVSTSIADVVRPYGQRGFAGIADEPADFIAAVERALETNCGGPWLGRVDAFLADQSWERTWSAMRHLVVEACQRNAARSRHDSHPAAAQVEERPSSSAPTGV